MLLLLLSCTLRPAPALESPGEVPCPEGTTAQGTPWPSAAALTPPPPSLPEDEASYFTRYALRCVDASGVEEGPFMSWYGNGQLHTRGEHSAGAAASWTRWDERGQVIEVASCPSPDACVITHTWWHEGGVRALEGTTRARLREGRWRQWGEDGSLTGEIVFSAGEPSEVVLDTRTLHLDPSRSIATASGALLSLPESSSWRQADAGILVWMDDAQLSVDGATLFSLSDGQLPDSELKGRLVFPLYERLLSTVGRWRTERGGDASPPLLLALPASTSSDTLLQILYTVGQAGAADDVQFVVTNPEAQLPPRTGPARLQGARLPMTVPLGPAGAFSMNDVPPEAWISLPLDAAPQDAWGDRLVGSDAPAIAIGLDGRTPLQDILSLIDAAREDAPERGVLFTGG